MTPRVLPVDGGMDDADAGADNGDRGNEEGDTGGSGDAKVHAHINIGARGDGRDNVIRLRG